jgi:hypothetical protein
MNNINGLEEARGKDSACKTSTHNDLVRNKRLYPWALVLVNLVALKEECGYRAGPKCSLNNSWVCLCQCMPTTHVQGCLANQPTLRVALLDPTPEPC